MKNYVKPNLKIKTFTLEDIICSSVENFSSYIDDSGDWGENPIINPDEPIDW